MENNINHIYISVNDNIMTAIIKSDRIITLSSHTNCFFSKNKKKKCYIISVDDINIVLSSSRIEDTRRVLIVRNRFKFIIELRL
jgi:hypothetical protein